MATARRSFLPILSLGGSILALFVSASGAGATTIHLRQFSSKSNASPALLDATLVFMLTGPSALTLTVTNGTTAPNGVQWNAAAHVTGLTVVSATHSQSGEVTAARAPVETNSHVAGFGTFDFGVTGGVGAKKDLLGSGQSLTFVFTIAGAGPLNLAATPSAAPIPEPDSAVLPEPDGAVLFLTGLGVASLAERVRGKARRKGWAHRQRSGKSRNLPSRFA